MLSRLQTVSVVNGANTRVSSLIDDFVIASAGAVAALREASGASNLLKAYRSKKIKQRGSVPERNVRYQFHGVGCQFQIGKKIVDVDFGPDGRHDGFDAWRLWTFAQSDLKRRPISLRAIEKGLSQLLEAGAIIKPGWRPSPHLYYFSSSAEQPGTHNGHQNGTRTQSQIDAILRHVQKKLDSKKKATGLALHVPPGGYAQDDDWLSVVIEPDTEGIRASQYVNVMGEIDEELRAAGVEKVTIVPMIGD